MSRARGAHGRGRHACTDQPAPCQQPDGVRQGDRKRAPAELDVRDSEARKGGDNRSDLPVHGAADDRHPVEVCP
jgi:hypothetical protein